MVTHSYCKASRKCVNADPDDGKKCSSIIVIQQSDGPKILPEMTEIHVAVGLLSFASADSDFLFSPIPGFPLLRSVTLGYCASIIRAL